MHIDGLSDLVEIGSGTNGIVHRATRDGDGRPVAVKVTRTITDPDSPQRFMQECRLLANLPAHPGVAPLLASGTTTNRQAYVVTPYYPAGSLADRLHRTGPVPWPEACELVTKVAYAVAHAHHFGLVHRSIKPANIVLDAAGQPVLVDFNSATLASGEMVATASGINLTPAYDPPEAFNAGAVDQRFDVYSLGATLHVLISGRLSFPIDDGLAAMVLAKSAVPPPDLRHLAPDSVCRCIERALAVDPAHRQQSAIELASELGAATATSGAGPLPSGAAHDPTRPAVVTSEPSQELPAPAGPTTQPQSFTHTVAANPPTPPTGQTGTPSTHVPPGGPPTQAAPYPPTQAAPGYPPPLGGPAPYVTDPAAQIGWPAAQPPGLAGPSQPSRLVPILVAVGVVLVAAIGAGWVIVRSLDGGGGTETSTVSALGSESGTDLGSEGSADGEVPPTTPVSTEAGSGDRTAGEATADQLRIGDCIAIPFGTGIFDTVTLRPCSETHNGEITGILEHPRAGSEYPGPDVLGEYAFTFCGPIFETYVGTDEFSTELYSYGLIPTFEEWGDGIYVVPCVASRWDNGNLTASVAGAANDPSIALDIGDPLPLSRLALGDCYVTPDASAGVGLARLDGIQQVVELANCTSPHEGEVVGGADLAGPEDGSYDLDALLAEAEPLCQEQFTLFTGLATDETGGLFAIVPELVEWGSGAQYTVCILLKFDGAGGSAADTT